MNKKSNSNLLTMGIIGGIIVVLFIAIIFLNNLSNKSKLEDNPYDKDDLDQATISLIGDENYSNIILPAELDKKIESGDTTFAYYFSPLCQYCKSFTPKLMPIAVEYDIHIDQLNVLEYPEEMDTYEITQTPTLVVYKDGAEVTRIIGDHEESNVRAFFDSVK